MGKIHPFTVRLSSAQYAAVSRISQKLGISVTNIVRLALARFIEEENHPAASRPSR
jgi:antitoxin component of RelBE/YafQ-DinJ toxin-antitoxin module